MNVQADVGQSGAQRFQTGDETIAGTVARAVVQLGLRGLGRRVLHGFQPGQEGRHADPAGNPDLASRRVVAVEAEVAVRAFDADRLPDINRVPQAAGEVAECLDAEGHRALVVARAGDGEGMMAFEAVESEEGKLPRLMALPALVEATGDLGDVVAALHGDDFAARPTALADAPSQRQHAGPAAGQKNDGEQGTEGCHPVAGWRQDEAVEGQEQVNHRQDAVDVPPEVVGKAPPEGDGDHRQQEIKAPFAEVLGRVVQQAGEFAFRLAQPPGPADERADKARAFVEAPVEDGENDGQDAGPFMQAVDAVHAAKRRFEPARAGCQHHDQRHQRHRQDATEVESLLADEPQRRGPLRDGGGQEGLQPGGAEQGQQTGECGGGRGVHRCSPFRVLGRSGCPSRVRLRYYACVFLNRA